MYKTSASVLKQISELIHHHSGIYFPENHLQVLDRKIQSYLHKFNLQEQEFYTKIVVQEKYLFNFVGYVTTNHTHFFRGIEQFNCIGDNIMSELGVKNVVTKHINIWSCACSTGEEPYTLALYLQHFFDTHFEFSDWTFSISATDIDLTSLEYAKTGLYPMEQLKYIPYMYHSYLNLGIPSNEASTSDEQYFSISQSLKKTVSFSIHNLIHSHNRSNYDIVFCRNVLIYFNDETQEKVVVELSKSLKKDRYFFISPTESLLNLQTDLESVILPKAIYYINK